MKDVYVVASPKMDAKGNYILIVSQGHGMFGGSSSAFSVDKVVTLGKGDRPTGYRGMVGNKTVVEFSSDSSFILLDKKVVRATNTLDLEIEDRREAAESKKRLETEFPEEGRSAVEITEEGKTRINNQGYL